MSNCTTGAKIISPRSEFLLFKNKDFHGSIFEDRVVIRRGVFAVEGTESWTDKSTDSDVFSGFSIAVNSLGLACCDSNVRMIPGARNYDLLTEEIAEKCKSVDDAITVAKNALHAQRYSWGNIVVATKDEVAALQIADGLKVFRHPVQTVRTNHHAEPDAQPTVYDGAVGTVKRYEAAERLLKKVENPDCAIDLLRSHEHGLSEFSVCSHGGLNTVYGYVIHVKNDQVLFHVCKGNPCTSNFIGLSVDFSDESSLRVVAQTYPSRFAPQIASRA